MFQGLADSRRLLGLAVVTWCGAAAPLAAQAPPGSRAGPVWTVSGLRTGQCVRFLLDPAVARRAAPGGTRLLPANGDESLNPALRSVIDGQAEFAAWIPSSLCLYYADVLDLGGRRFRSKDPRKRRMIGAWTVAALGQGSGTREDAVMELFGVGGGLVQAAAYVRVKLGEAQSSVSKVEGTENELYDVKIGKTRLSWNGRAVGDSTRVVQPIQESWLTRGAAGMVWRVEVTLKPEWSRLLVGALSVAGDDDLAQALKASPIRFVGPLYQGGGAELRFFR